MTVVDTPIAAATESPARWATEPFVMGTPGQFARLRSWLDDVGYTQANLCGTAKVSSIAFFKSLESGRVEFSTPTDVVSLLVLLFLDGQRLPWDTVNAVLSPTELATLEDLGLVQAAVADSNLCVGTIALFPDENLLVASDRLSGMETVGKGAPSDLVFSPLTKETRKFIALMPRTSCEAYLELCGGTGIAALIAARGFAKHAVSADITERSTRFAQFNAALNGLGNMTAVRGDLYDPVAGQTFDMISAHPPYVPAEETEMVFRDGGADGEQITRRIVGRLSQHLRPGGLFYLDCVVTDRTGEKIERRLRRMLGPDEDEFDVIVVRHGETDIKHYLAARLADGRTAPEMFIRQTEFFRRAGIERLVDVTTLMHRRNTFRPVVTRQHASSGEAGAADLLWLLRYHSSSVTWSDDDVRRLLDNRVRALPQTELHTRSVLRDGAWVQESETIGTNAPFAAGSPCPPWFPAFLARCDGTRTARELLAWLRETGVVPNSTSDQDFAELLHELADAPFVELDAFPLPEPSRLSGFSIA